MVPSLWEKLEGFVGYAKKSFHISALDVVGLTCAKTLIIGVIIGCN